MAEITRKQVPPATPEFIYEMEFTEKEMMLLYMLLGRCVGDDGLGYSFIKIWNDINNKYGNALCSYSREHGERVNYGKFINFIKETK